MALKKMSVSANFIRLSDRQDKYVIGPICSRAEMSDVASNTMYTMHTQSKADITSVLCNDSPNRTECPMKFHNVLFSRTEFNETWQEARSQCPLPSLCFSGRSEKQDGHPGLWLAETFLTSSLKPVNGIQQSLTGRKILTSSTSD